MTKEEQELVKITAFISPICKHELEILSAYMQKNISQTIKFIIEQNVSNILSRIISKRTKSMESIKSMENNNEE